MTRPTFRSDMTVELLDRMGTDDKVAEMARGSIGAGRSSHDANVRLIQKLMSEGHKVPFEHCAMTFRIECPIFVSRQLVKHRHSSISELSGRYTEMPGVFYTPAPGRPLGQQGGRMAYDMVHLPVDDNLDARQGMESIAAHAWSEYEYLLKIGVSRELARTVLPTSLYTELRMTVNLLSLMNILKLRIDWKKVAGEHAAFESHPQREVELVALGMCRLMEEEFPAVTVAFSQNGWSI